MENVVIEKVGVILHPVKDDSSVPVKRRGRPAIVKKNFIFTPMAGKSDGEKATVIIQYNKELDGQIVKVSKAIEATVVDGELVIRLV